MTLEALKLAYNAHEGQLDRGGLPYIFHPYHLAEQMDDEITTTVALLHDVVEDTYITLDVLEKIFPSKVVEAVDLLTHDETKDYFEYVKRIKSNPIAVKVKLADLEHNSDQSRTVGVNQSEEKLKQLNEKYKKAKAILLE